VAFLPDRRSTSWPKIQGIGRFCVNILSAEQEALCRTFSSPAEDRFAGLACQEAESGAPIIPGAVAWIDCDLEAVHEAGDHYIVIGRARRLEIENPCLPLLFFQGGYGRFAPLSLAAGDRQGSLTSQLRDVDLVRPEMERVAADIPGARCTAAAVVDAELVVTASAGGLDSTSPATLVGQRLPFAPPLGAALAAWMDDAELEHWLKDLPSEQARTDQRLRLAAVRRRGFSVALRTDAHRRLESTLARLAAEPDGVDRDALHRHVRELDFEPVDLSPEVKADIGVITVPVFGRDGHAIMMLTAYGYPRPAAAGCVDAFIERMKMASDRATNLLCGRLPSDT
jgi:Flavin reductase like domain